MDESRIIQSPFLAHVWKMSIKTYNIHDIRTHVKGRDNQSGDNSIERVFSSGHSQIF